MHPLNVKKCCDLDKLLLQPEAYFTVVLSAMLHCSAAGKEKKKKESRLSDICDDVSVCLHIICRLWIC